MPHITKNTHTYRLLLLPLVLILILAGCSTQKDAFVNRAFHSVNAKYNGFFNARESYKEGVGQLKEQHTDNFEEILSVFQYGTEQDASSVKNNMDVAYEKASLVIRKHSMDIRGEEHNKWIDESYFLIGRSHFFKRDFTLAILTFEYIIREYDTRRSHDAKAWIAKCYHEQGRYERALPMLELLESHYNDGLLNDNTVALFRKAYADHYIRQEQYDKAAEQLQQGLSYVDDRHEHARLTFIQAQLYEHSGNNKLAQQTYERVLDMRTSHQMAFQARIGMAMAYDAGLGGSDAIRAELRKMLSEDRNRIYRDQIYYALAQLALEENDEQEAIELFNKAAEASEENDLQKGLAFLRLGEIYFEHPDYQEATLYYDSATTYIPRGYDDYEGVQARQQILSSLASQMEVIEREDSLQNLAAMTEEEQLVVAEDIIEELRRKEEERKESERQRRQEMREAGRTARQTRGTGSQDSGWYFYNTNAMERGEMEFFSNYGDRPLEDLWRISNKQTMAGGFDMDMPGIEDMAQEEDTLELDEYDVDTYLRNIPNTEEQMQASKDRQIQAHYNMGVIFREQLEDLENAINSFSDLVNEFPGSDKELFAYYYLYNLNQNRGNYSESEQIKDELISKYPDSEFAKILGDPDYADQVREKQNQAQQLYEESYNAFFNGRYEVVRENLQAIDTLEVSRELKARFVYLNALAYGKEDDQPAFRNLLQNIIQEYDDTPVHQPASVLLASMEASETEMAEDGETPATTPEMPEIEDIESPFTYDPENVHFFVLLLDVNQHEVAGISSRISDFNEERYADNDLTVNNVYFEDDKQLITIINFEDQQKSLDYYNELLDMTDMGNPEQDVFEPFVISVDNYPLLYQDKELEAYRRFFNHYYLRP